MSGRYSVCEACGRLYRASMGHTCPPPGSKGDPNAPLATVGFGGLPVAPQTQNVFASYLNGGNVFGVVLNGAIIEVHFKRNSQTYMARFAMVGIDATV